jgi:hypothetical protein
MRLIYVCNMDSISLCLRSWWLKRLHLNKTPGNIRKVIYIINSAGYLNRIYAEDVFAPYKATWYFRLGVFILHLLLTMEEFNS